MARPERHDVDYFPFYVKRGKTLNILQAKYGLEGIGFFTQLFRFLSVTPDHHYQIFDPIDRMNFFAEIGMNNESVGMEILDLLAATGKIDGILWTEKKVICSQDFLKSVTDAYNRRTNDIITIEAIREHYGVKDVENEEKSDNNQQATELLCEIIDSNPQTKVKETKVKETKVKETKENTGKKPFETNGTISQKQISLEAARLAQLMVDLHKQNWKPDYAPRDKDVQSWARDIDLMHRIDGRPWDEIEKAVRFAKTMPVSSSGFTWATNIMSGAKLRLHFDKLIVQANAKTLCSKPVIDRSNGYVLDSAVFNGELP